MFAMMLSTDAAASQTRQKSATNFSVSSSNTPHTVAPVRRPPLFNLGAGAVAPLHDHWGRTATDSVHLTQRPSVCASKLDVAV